jgi:hypothetical protein
MSAARHPSEKQLARDRADRNRFDEAAAVIRSEATQALHKIGVFPDRAYPFASLLNAMALEVETLPSSVRAEGLAVALRSHNTGRILRVSADAVLACGYTRP